MIIRLLALFLLLIKLQDSLSVVVDNSVEGDPELTCGESFIGLKVKARNPIEGHLFVKGQYIRPECREDGNGVTTFDSIELKLDWNDCGITRTRSKNPPGVFVSTTVIMAFHPLFITKKDRAYMIQCYYMEKKKTITTEIEIEMLTTAMQTQVVPMPICRYEVLDNFDGQPIYYAEIGQSVFHKWTCDSDTEDVFCMTVHSCKVDDGAGDSIMLIDQDGCTADQFLLGNLDYVTDLMAIREAHVFKYADRATLFFDCQITINVKEPNMQCIRPFCANSLRSKRDSKNHTSYTAVVLDPNSTVNNRSETIVDWDMLSEMDDDWSDDSTHFDPSGACMSLAAFGGFALFNVALLAMSALMLSAAYTTRRRKNERNVSMRTRLAQMTDPNL